MENAVVGSFQSGDKVRVKMRSYTGNKARVYTGVIEGVYPRFLTINTGKYRITVSATDLARREATIELLVRKRMSANLVIDYGKGLEQWRRGTPHKREALNNAGHE